MGIHHIYITEEQARDASVLICIKRKNQEDPDTIYSVLFREENEGSLYMEVSEDSDPDVCITNNYPEFFTPKVKS